MEVIVDQEEKRSWVEIDLNQVERNLRCFRNSLKKPVEIIGVIKADAYGHGDVRIARCLEENGIHFFAVSNIDEAVGLRNAGIEGDILILGYSSPIYAKTISRLDLTQTIVSEEYAEALMKTGKRIKCQVAIDTGMNRIGIPSNDVQHTASLVRKYAQFFQLTGIFTHLCAADGASDEDYCFTRRQLESFKKVSDELNDLNLPFIHCYNSAGALFHLENDEFNETIGRVVRLGIVLYGLKPDWGNSLPEGIKPVLVWKSVISMVKEVEEGQTISYGRTFKTTRPSRIATVTTGYADGYNRALSNKGFVLVRGFKAPVVGRICMDQTLIDVTDIPGVKMGDTVILLGEDGGFRYDADAMAHDLGTIGYEVVCQISKRVQRYYLNNGNTHDS